MSELRDAIGQAIIRAFERTYREHEIGYNPDTCYQAADEVVAELVSRLTGRPHEAQQSHLIGPAQIVERPIPELREQWGVAIVREGRPPNIIYGWTEQEDARLIYQALASARTLPYALVRRFVSAIEPEPEPETPYEALSEPEQRRGAVLRELGPGPGRDHAEP